MSGEDKCAWEVFPISEGLLTGELCVHHENGKVFRFRRGAVYFNEEKDAVRYSMAAAAALTLAGEDVWAVAYKRGRVVREIPGAEYIIEWERPSVYACAPSFNDMTDDAIFEAVASSLALLASAERAASPSDGGGHA